MKGLTVRLTRREKETVLRCLGETPRNELLPAIRKWLARHNRPARAAVAWDRARLINVACKAAGMNGWQTAPFEPAFLHRADETA
jgi:hypothetical protein